jgi:hypothetical protein
MFLLCCKRRNLVVVTTSDGKQLYNQTFPNLSLFAEAINKKLRETGFSTGDEDFIEVKLGSISCSQTGGLIKAFVTDDPGRAEGYHPWADEPESQLTLIINEGKTVSASIFQAFRRCNPYTRYIAVSSTGPDSGYFYEHAIKAVTYPEKLNLKKPYTRYVTSYDCPHVDKELIERDKEELEPWLFDSIHMSRFSSLGGCFCIPSNVILANTFSKDSPSYNDSDYSVGLDLSMGGDETGLVVRKGPFIVSENYFREQNANLLESAILMTIENLDLPDGTMVFADVGGIGKPIISHLREKYPRLQWIEVANQGAARNTSLYLNAGVEDYFHYRNLLEKSLVPAPSKEDTKLFTQLTSRRYVIHKQKYRLEEKKEARNRGERSPDRADARVLAYRRYRCRVGVYVEPTKKVEQKVLISATAPDLEDKLLEAIRSRELPTKGVQGRQTSASAIYRHLC